jgi:ribosomal subunit interface protein
MNLELHFRNSNFAEALQTFLERRLQFALSSFGSQVGLVTVRLADANDRRGKGLRRCEITAELVPSGNVVATEANADLYVAVDRAVRRIVYLLRKQFDLKRRSRPNVGGCFHPHTHTASLPRFTQGGLYARAD